MDNSNLNNKIPQYSEALPKYRQIYDYLLQEISAGNLKPGDKLPSEKDLCASFNVSRITTKKALEMLVEGKIISRQRGRGSFVNEASSLSAPGKNAASFRTIAFLTPTFNDSFGTRLLYSVENTAEALGYHVILKLTHEDPVKEENALRDLDDKNVAGILMIPVHGEHYTAEILKQVLNKRPLVFVDRKMRGLPVPSVSTDCVAASEMAVRGLLKQGHRHIAFYSWPVIHTSTVEDRRQGFTRAFTGSGIPLNPAYICDNLPLQDGLDVITNHLSKNPHISAVFTAQFEIALLVKRALSALNRKIRRDFAVITFDHPNYAEEFPEFSYLRQNEESIGRQAVEVLHRIIQGESGEDINDILIPAELETGIPNDR